MKPLACEVELGQRHVEGGPVSRVVAQHPAEQAPVVDALPVPGSMDHLLHDLQGFTRQMSDLQILSRPFDFSYFSPPWSNIIRLTAALCIRVASRLRKVRLCFSLKTL